MARYNMTVKDEDGEVSLEAVMNWLGGVKRARRALRGELVLTEPERKWSEHDGVLSFTLTSDGTTGPEWITRLEKAGYRLSKWAKDLLTSPDFVPSEKGTVHDVRVLKGMLWNDSDRITKKVRAEAAARGLAVPNPEVACLIRLHFSDKELEAMGLWWIVTMHEPIKDSVGDADLLEASRNDGGRWLNAFCDNPGRRWDRGDGFAFVAAQVSA